MAVWLRSRGPSTARRYAFGLSGVVEFSTTPSPELAIIGRPQVAFRGERLTIPSVMGAASAPGGTFAPGTDVTVRAADFMILDVLVGNSSQLASSGGIPGVVFSENAYGVALRVDTAQVAQDVAVRVSYVGPLSIASLVSGAGPIVVPFRAAVIGTAVL
jgi:hypothetical protein